MVRQIKQYVHPASIAPYFNNWLATGRLPTEPEKMRPLTVTSCLVRLFHRILARRFERYLPSSALQRGFKAGDGCGSNKRLLEAIIHERIGYKDDRGRSGAKDISLVFIDVKKALDSINHGAILQALRVRAYPRYWSITSVTFTQLAPLVLLWIKCVESRVCGTGRETG